MGDVVSCGYAPIVAIVADHEDWPAPGWFGGTITRDATLVSPQQCQVCLTFCQPQIVLHFTSNCGVIDLRLCYVATRPSALQPPTATTSPVSPTESFSRGPLSTHPLFAPDEWELTAGEMYHECYLK